jgi:FkbH-like protein
VRDAGGSDALAGAVVTDPAADAAAYFADRLALQGLALGEKPRRLDLLRWRTSWPLKPIRIRVHRNQPFEFVASVLPPFLALAGFEPTVDIGPYDDALSGVGEPPAQAADVELLWLDFARYLEQQGSEAVAAWLGSRARVLRQASSAPILVAATVARDATTRQLNKLLAEAVAQTPGSYLIDQAAVADQLGAAYLDPRSETFAGSGLSDAAAIETARRFGLFWIPGVLIPRFKAIVLDLDHTLYDGVLAEDGPTELLLSPDRAAVQRRLVELSDSGILLAVLTRNEPEDVERLFRERPDFPLRPERFSAVVASWRPKPEGMASISETLHIGTDSILFVDDNPGELAAVSADLPEIVPLLAADPKQALCGLRWYPGLAAMRTTREDGLRAADLASDGARRPLATHASDPLAYLGSLSVRLVFARSPVDQVVRIHELSTKTNQFNTSLLRLSEAEVAGLLADPACVLVTVSLRDRLSDSGTVGLIIVRATPGLSPIVEEVAISCRSLGRGVEDAIIGEAIRGALGASPPRVIRFAFLQGPRNGPARDWLSRISGARVEQPEVEVPWSRLEGARAKIAPLLELVWRE